MKTMKTIAAVLVLLFLAGNAFADKAKKTKTVTYKFKDATAQFGVQTLDESDPDCVVTSAASIYVDSNVTMNDGTTHAFMLTATYIIDYCGNIFYADGVYNDPSVVNVALRGVKGAQVQGDLVLKTWDGLDVPMSVDVSLSCNTPVDEIKQKIKEVNNYVTIVRKSLSQSCNADFKGTLVVSGIEFIDNPNIDLISAGLAFIKEGEMTITRKVR